jgi:hypothetical protein
MALLQHPWSFSAWATLPLLVAGPRALHLVSQLRAQKSRVSVAQQGVPSGLSHSVTNP